MVVNALQTIDFYKEIEAEQYEQDMKEINKNKK